MRGTFTTKGWGYFPKIEAWADLQPHPRPPLFWELQIIDEDRGMLLPDGYKETHKWVTYVCLPSLSGQHDKSVRFLINGHFKNNKCRQKFN
jgi:hypothetical protein